MTSNPLSSQSFSQSPGAIELVMDNNSRDLIVNRAVPPFDNLELRRAMALSLDRRYLDRGPGNRWRQDPAAAGRDLGDAGRCAAHHARLWARCAEEPRGISRIKQRLGQNGPRLPQTGRYPRPARQRAIIHCAEELVDRVVRESA